jgi:hypothetical protein
LPLLLQGSVPQWHWVGNPFPTPTSFLASWPPDGCMSPDPSALSSDSREESVLGSVLLPSYTVRPDGPGALRGRRFTFTVSPSILYGS